MSARAWLAAASLCASALLFSVQAQTLKTDRAADKVAVEQTFRDYAATFWTGDLKKVTTFYNDPMMLMPAARVVTSVEVETWVERIRENGRSRGIAGDKGGTFGGVENPFATAERARDLLVEADLGLHGADAIVGVGSAREIKALATKPGRLLKHFSNAEVTQRSVSGVLGCATPIAGMRSFCSASAKGRDRVPREERGGHYRR